MCRRRDQEAFTQQGEQIFGALDSNLTSDTQPAKFAMTTKKKKTVKDFISSNWIKSYFIFD